MVSKYTTSYSRKVGKSDLRKNIQLIYLMTHSKPELRPEKCNLRKIRNNAIHNITCWDWYMLYKNIHVFILQKKDSEILKNKKVIDIQLHSFANNDKLEIVLDTVKTC